MKKIRNFLYINIQTEFVGYKVDIGKHRLANVVLGVFVKLALLSLENKNRLNGIL